MYRIYFNKRCLGVCSLHHKVLKDADAIIYDPAHFPPIEEIAVMFDKATNIEKLYIPSLDPENTFKLLCSTLTPIQAAGGIVTNSKGHYLIIFHHGVWDFPKGMQEPGETLEATALREVEEECGVQQLQIINHLCNTFHTYHRDGHFYIKTTAWYRMTYNGNGTTTTPQSSEEIERAIWAPKEELQTYFSDSYPSIIYLSGGC